MQVSLACRAVSHSYGDLLALDQVTISHEGTGCIALIGANGAGKSTLLRGIVGALMLSQGEIIICGEAMYPESIARRQLGYLSERPSLPNELSVYEWLCIVGRLHKLSGRYLYSRVEWVLDRCSLDSLKSRRCDSLSRGQRQRVGVASSIIHRPALLVLDEVHSGLDPIQTNEMNKLLGELAEEQLVLLSTHRLDAALQLTHEFWVLDQGRLLAAGPLESWSKAISPDIKGVDRLRNAYLELVANTELS